tara:strand:- start:3447 stop:5384 length:1938 start_codon:yes stop_codon:yes gene_type:complete
MQKVRFVIHQDDVDAALSIIQKAGAFEIHEAEEVTETVNSPFPHTQLLPRVQHAVAFLDQYAPEVGLWTKLREGIFTELSETEIQNRLDNIDVIEAVVDDLEKLQVEFADTNESVRSLEEARELLSEWKDLPVALDELETASSVTWLVSTKALDTTLKHKLDEAINGEIPAMVTEVAPNKAAVTFFNNEETAAAVKEIIEPLEASTVALPEGKETPDVELVAIEEKLAKAKGEQALLHDQAEHFAITHLKNLHIAGEILSWQRDRFSAVESAQATKSTAVFVGWLNQNKRAQIEQALSAKNVAAVCSDAEVAEGEEPPVEIENSTFMQPFEVVTRLYGMPGYQDLDPTVFLAGFFFLFFGLSLTDVGYGVFLMAVSAIILTLFKVAPIVRTFAKLLMFMGLASALVGLLFGGYLGIDPEMLPASLRAIQMFDPIGNPLPVFYLALGLGVVQVMVGMMIKIYSDALNGKFMEGVLDQGPWLLMFSIGILYLATSTGYISVLSLDTITNLIYVGIALIVLASGRKGDTILQKAQSAALSLYDSIGYFSDILSYSRLLALGLATTALAFAVNLIAEIVSESVPYLGPVLAVVVLIIGHLFTLAVNTLGAFIHSARLQFVEFFGKFIAGTGRQFNPLSRTEKYVTVKKE